MKVFLTGGTGVMGMATLRELLNDRGGRGEGITVLAREGKKNRKKLAPFVKKGVRIVWGNLLNLSDIKRGIKDADIVLHVGGMVSPAADWQPELTYRVNTIGMTNIIEAAKEKEEAGKEIAVVYIGSVSQYGNRAYPSHWGRCGDPIASAVFDKYALSKSVAEKMLSESGLKRWVSLRQTGIMHPGVLLKASDPIAFHVPMASGLEWITDRASGRLLAGVCREGLPEKFWKNYYNIGGGESYRYRNYDFVKLTLDAVGCPPPEKVFDLNWFATQNFHGMFFEDSDRLDEIIPYRDKETFAEYMSELKRQLPFYFRLAPLAPAALIKSTMKRVAETKVLGPLYWIKNDIRPRIEAFFGGIENYRKIPDWKDAKLPDLTEFRGRLDHGYDESKEIEEITLGELRRAAEFRGGKCLTAGADQDKPGADNQIEWECSEGHRFSLTPRTVLKGGHWCGACLEEMNENPAAFRRLAEKSAFLRQIDLRV